MRVSVRVLSPVVGSCIGYGFRFHVLSTRRAAPSLLLVGAGSRSVRRLTAGILPLQPHHDDSLQFQVLMLSNKGSDCVACSCIALYCESPRPGRSCRICRCGSLPFLLIGFPLGSLPLPRPRPGHGSLPSSCNRPTMEKTQIKQIDAFTAHVHKVCCNLF